MHVHVHFLYANIYQYVHIIYHQLIWMTNPNTCKRIDYTNRPISIKCMLWSLRSAWMRLSTRFQKQQWLCDGYDMSADCTLQRCYSTFYINTQRIGIQIRQNLLFRVCRFQRGVHEPEKKQRVQKDEEKKLSVRLCLQGCLFPLLFCGSQGRKKDKRVEGRHSGENERRAEAGSNQCIDR